MLRSHWKVRKQWNSEFGFYVFSFSVQQCKDIYGSKFVRSFIQAGINRTNTMYGGYGLKVTRVVFPNGSIDPWHALGVTKDLSKEATALYIQGKHGTTLYYIAVPSFYVVIEIASRFVDNINEKHVCRNSPLCQHVSRLPVRPTTAERR